jgi:biotin carboxyl carrier protein
VTARRSFKVLCGQTVVSVDVQSAEKVVIDKELHHVEILSQGMGNLFVKIDDKIYHGYYRRHADGSGEFYYGHRVIDATLADAEHRFAEYMQSGSAKHSPLIILKAPMPGLIGSVQVNLGDAVQPGSTIMTLEAMKMENEIRSTVHGIVKKIEVKTGQTVDKDQSLVELDTGNANAD